jgi:Fur family transcriptional regulator, ferric uptake regulator
LWGGPATPSRTIGIPQSLPRQTKRDAVGRRVSLVLTHFGLGLATVYRILHRLADQHIAEAQRGEDGETLYRLRATTEHHHYLMCCRCGAAVAFSPAALEHHTAELARKHRYADITHHIDLYGVCPRCIDE